MAETTAKRKGRPPKKTEEIKTEVEVKEEVVSENSTKDTRTPAEIELEQTKKMLAEMQAQMVKMQEQMSAKTEVVVKQMPSRSNDKIKCISLSPNPVNISTLPNNRGKKFTFEKYGSSWSIRRGDLEDVVSSYENTMKSGLIYVCDRDFIEEQGLDEYYNNSLYSKELLDKLVYLREDADVEMFLNMSKQLQEATAVRIARLFKMNEHYEPNVLARIKTEAGFDIEQMAKEYVEMK